MISSIQLSSPTPQLSFGVKKPRRGKEGHHGIKEASLQYQQYRRALCGTDTGKYTTALEDLVRSAQPPQSLSFESGKKWLGEITGIKAPDVLDRLAAKLPEVVEKLRKAA